MRTQKLLAVAAVLAVSIASSIAQPYSGNIVGYVNVTVPSGYSILANPLSKDSTNSADSILPIIDGSTYLTWNGTGYDFRGYDSGFGGWVDANNNPATPPLLPPGKAFFFFNPNPATNITFVGNVIPQPGTTNSLPLPSGYSMIGSVLPVGGSASTIGLPVIDGMFLLKWNGSGFTYTGYDSGFGGWVDANNNPSSEFSANVAQGFFYFNSLGTTNWKQSLP